MVIGDEVDQQLAPYNEEIQVAPYRKYDDPDWLFRFYAKELPEQPEPTLEELIAWINERWEDDGEKYGIDELGVYALSTYNPDSKWDWYTVGGRWRGFFKLTPAAMDRATEARVGEPGVFGNEPTYDADQVQKGDVDVEAMRSASGDAAGKSWDRAHALFAGTPEPDSWATVRARHEDTKEGTDAARAEYNTQPRLEAIRKHDELCRKEDRWDETVLDPFGSLETYDVSRDAYVQRVRDNAICPYAYLKDGEWFAPGEMGWWGMSSDTDDDQARFAREFNELFDALPDDTLLIMVDCHI
jgi:hypothetical protein